MTPTVTLDESTHIYKVDGVVKPSVTQVLNEWLLVDNWYVNITTGVRIPQDSFEGAGDFGRAFHKAAKFIMQGKEIKYPPELDHAISELKRWKDDNGIIPIHLEMAGYSYKLDICGTLDIACHITKGRHANDDLNIPDYKTTKIHPTVGPQVWAYEQILRSMTQYKGRLRRWLVEFPKKEGSYKFIELKDNLGDEHFFKSCNYVYCWKRRV